MSSKAREALEEAHALLEKIHSAYSDRQGDISMYPLRKVIKIVNEALAEPVRNCDVGTAEEQDARHQNFCDATRNGLHGYHCGDAPQCVFCFAKWSQMPYKKEGEQ